MGLHTNAKVNKEPTRSLVGLKIKVLDTWWNNSDSSGNILHPGRIHSIDFAQKKNQNYWQLQLDDVAEPELYHMRYTDVLAYADDYSTSYRSFMLPVQFVANPVNKRDSQN